MTHTKHTARAIDPDAVRTMAIAHNHASLVRWAKREGFTVADVEATIDSGEVVVVGGQDRTSDGTYVVYAVPAVRMPAGSPLGEFAHATDVVEATVSLPRGMPTYKAGPWWARKHFGAGLPFESVTGLG